MGGRCVIRLHYINVKPTRNNSNFKISLKGYSSVVDHCLTCTRFHLQPRYRKEKDKVCHQSQLERASTEHGSLYTTVKLRSHKLILKSRIH